MTPSQAPVGRLLVCSTPIGNLEDVTLRVLAALRAADAIACEDTRHTRLLLDRHGIDTPLVSFHEHNERARARELVARIRAGAAIALVSDAGTPLVSDPGFALVRGCLAAGLPVEALPGPSAVLAALVASGLPAERWRFVGFLPRKRAERERLLERTEETLVAFESPRRLAATLAQLAEHDPRRPLAVCRELTKLHEEVRRGSAAELAAHYRDEPPRGEVAIVVGAGEPGQGARAEALAAVAELVEAGVRARTAAGVVGRLTGVGANELYRELMRRTRGHVGSAPCGSS
jgi:16S rRNA (cytidine1402-2'-O)-methyltransferase